jgi:hypothetical protein
MSGAKIEVLGGILIATGIVLFHIGYLILVLHMKNLGIQAGYRGQFLNFSSNIRKYKTYCQTHGLSLGSSFWAMRAGQCVGVSGVLLTGLGLFNKS